MATHELLEWGEERLRLSPWRRDAVIGYLAPLPGATPPRSDSILRSVRVAADRGFSEVVTSALAPHEMTAFLAAGFTPREELHLLSHDLEALPDASLSAVRRGRRSDRTRVLEVDRLAFDEFWNFDDLGFVDALHATPSSRFRVAEDADGSAVGYAVHGRAGRIGYVQRLAVDPAAHGRRLGLALLVDGLRWMRRRGCRRAVVNTQVGNERALRLYLATGFRHEPHGLTVLGRRVDGA